MEDRPGCVDRARDEAASVKKRMAVGVAVDATTHPPARGRFSMAKPAWGKRKAENPEGGESWNQRTQDNDFFWPRVRDYWVPPRRRTSQNRMGVESVHRYSEIR